MSNNDITRLAGANGKFSCCLMNPPYDNGLGNSFLEKVLQISDKVITIQPTSWLITKKQSKRITNLVDRQETEIDFINGYKEFDAGIMGELAIQSFDMTKKGKIHIYDNEYDKCEDIKLWSNDSILEKFIEKIEPVNDSLWEHIKGTIKKLHNYEPNPDNNWWCVKIPMIRGNVASNQEKKESSDFYTIISNDSDFMSKNIGKYSDIKLIPNNKGKFEFGYFAFDTENELHNFINYIKTDFVRACLKLTKKNANQFRGELKFIPWQDFTNPVFARSPKQIDDYLFKKYNISNDIRQHIEEILPDYYGIR